MFREMRASQRVFTEAATQHSLASTFSWNAWQSLLSGPFPGGKSFVHHTPGPVTGRLGHLMFYLILPCRVLYLGRVLPFISFCIYLFGAFTPRHAQRSGGELAGVRDSLLLCRSRGSTLAASPFTSGVISAAQVLHSLMVSIHNFILK